MPRFSPLERNPNEKTQNGALAGAQGGPKCKRGPTGMQSLQTCAQAHIERGPGAQLRPTQPSTGAAQAGMRPSTQTRGQAVHGTGFCKVHGDVSRNPWKLVRSRKLLSWSTARFCMIRLLHTIPGEIRWLRGFRHDSSLTQRVSRTFVDDRIADNF